MTRDPRPAAWYDLAAYHYDLPDALIARHPAPARDGSRLLLLDAPAGTRAHHRFSDLPDLLPPGALLVVNDARVVPARLWCNKPSGGRVEVFVLEALPDGSARALVRASRRPKAGVTLTTERGGRPLLLAADEGEGRMRVACPEGAPVSALLDAEGEIPLPPYLGRAEEPADRERYQTVYAATPGAVAAPTAGLHFTPALLAALEARGFGVARLTLHVGPGTFKPVESPDVRAHVMEGERVAIPGATARAVDEARAAGRPVVAVGTTVVRALESAVGPDGRVRPGEALAEGFILPGHRFRAVDHLVTNFHLPGSTLLLLVSALAGRDAILAAYREAVALGYRFYSYGDAMFIRVAGGAG